MLQKYPQYICTISHKIHRKFSKKISPKMLLTFQFFHKMYFQNFPNNFPKIFSKLLYVFNNFLKVSYFSVILSKIVKNLFRIFLKFAYHFYKISRKLVQIFPNLFKIIFSLSLNWFVKFFRCSFKIMSIFFEVFLNYFGLLKVLVSSPWRRWRYGDARMPNWPHRNRTLLPGIVSPGLCWNKGGTIWGRQPFCPSDIKGLKKFGIYTFTESIDSIDTSIDICSIKHYNSGNFK